MWSFFISLGVSRFFVLFSCSTKATEELQLSSRDTKKSDNRDCADVRGH